MTIKKILATELDAFYRLQQEAGANGGAVMNYYAPLPGALMSPYSAQIAIRYALAAYRGRRAPAPLVSMARNYIGYALKKVMWTLGKAPSGSTDAAGHAYLAGDQVMTLYDGSVFAIPKSYRTPAGQGGGKMVAYTEMQQVNVARNVENLFIKGCPLSQYARNSDGLILPGWVVNTPDMSFITQLDQIRGATYQEIHDAWYDATDSAAATLVSVIGEYLRTQSDASFKAWLISNWQVLIGVADASLATIDPITNLAVAAPYTNAEYTLDNIEVWRGLKEFCYIMQRAVQIDRATFSAPFDATGKSPDDQFRTYASYCVRTAAAISRYCQLNGAEVDSLFTPGWNRKIQATLKPFFPTDPQYLDTFSFMLLDSYWSADPGGAHANTRAQASYFSTMASQGLSKPSSTRPPDVWRYVIGANAINSSTAPFTRAAYESWLANVNTTCIVGANRNYRCWWSAESGALIWLCNILLSKGSA